MTTEITPPLLFNPQMTFDVLLAPTAVRSADFNADGSIDLVVGGPSSKISVLLGDGIGGFLTPRIQN